MKRFFGKLLLLSLPFALSIGVLNFFYTRTNYWKINIIGDTLKFKNVPGHIQLANVGSSHGRDAFDYGNVPYTSFNFSLSSQRFLYDYAVLEQYIDRFDKNAVLLIPVSYFQITRVKNDFSDQRARYYRFLDKEYMDFYSLQEKQLYAPLVPVLRAGDTLKFIINDIPPVENKVMTEPELIEYSAAKYISWTADNQYESEMGEEGFAHNKYLLSQIIELCYANDIQPVLVSTPITSVLNSIYAEESPGFFDGFYRFTRELQEAYPGLPYFDYSHDPRFTNGFSLFRNGDHLNPAGAEKFTALVLSDLEANGIVIPGP